MQFPLRKHITSGNIICSFFPPIHPKTYKEGIELRCTCSVQIKSEVKIMTSLSASLIDAEDSIAFHVSGWLQYGVNLTLTR